MKYRRADLPQLIRDEIHLGRVEGCTLPEACWVWLGRDNGKEYGRARVGGREWLTHRLAYTLLVGPIPEGLQLDHLCRNTRCLNPTHLEPVTNQENALRGERATKTHCIRNHPLSGDNLKLKRPGDGVRQCRICYDAAIRRATERRRLQRIAERAAKADRIQRIRRGLAVAS